jgi:putative intracellular protease/amidase
MQKVMTIGVVLFDGFELLDVFGPLEMFGMYPETFDIVMVAEQVGFVASAQGPASKVDRLFSDEIQHDILLVPGGQGTRVEVNNSTLLDWLTDQAKLAEYVTSVCTGSALLAKAGLLDGMRATGNKMNFSFVMSQGPNVNWVKEARWVEHDKFFTSSGVSAGIDMSLGLIEKVLGKEAAKQSAIWAEYDWHEDASWDPFAKIHGLV